MIQIKQLFIYPVKSCAGIQVDSAEALPFGFAGDRRWMIVNEKGQMLTQRKIQKLALIKPILNKGDLQLSHAKAGNIDVEINEDNGYREVSIWKDSVQAKLAKPEVSAWISEALESKEALQLVHYQKSEPRLPGQAERFGDTARHFADAAPFLVANQASLDALNQSLIEQDIDPVDIRHFRPNIVIEGLPAFEEHSLHSLDKEDGETRIRLVDHCQRCVMITVDPDTGELRPKATPFKQLSALNAMPGMPKAPAFGVNCTISSQASFHVGEGLSPRN